MAGDVYVSFGADTGELEGAFALARAQTQGLSKEINSLAREMRSTGASADSDLGQRLNALGNELALAKQESRELSEALKVQKVEAAETGAAMEALGRAGELAKAGLELAGVAIGAEALKSLVEGVTDGAEQTERAAAKLGATTTEIQQIGAVAKLTGSDFERMSLQLERLQLGLAKSESASSPARAALAALGLEADKFRQLRIPEQLETLAEAFSRFADGPTKTAAAMALLGRAGADMIPYLDRGKEGLEELTKAAAETGVVLSDKDVKALAETAEESHKLGLAVQALGQEFVVALDPAIESTLKFLIRLIEGLKAAAAEVTHFFDTINSYAGDEVKLAAAAAIPTDAVEGGRDVTVNAKPKVPELQLGKGGGRGSKASSGKEESQEATESYREQVDAAKRAAEDTIAALDSQVREHKISWQEWSKESVAALEIERSAITAAGASAVNSDILTAAQKIRIARETSNQIAEINKKEAADQTKAVQEEARQWQTALGTVVSSVNSQLKSVISGAESWKTALVNIFEEFATKAVEYLEKIAVEEIAIKLVSTAIGLPIPSFAVGAWELPGDTLAQVHAGEMIIPAGPAENLRTSLSGSSSGAPASAGGGSVSVNPQTHFHVSAIDGAGTAAFFRQNGGGIAKSLHEATRQGATLGLRRFSQR